MAQIAVGRGLGGAASRGSGYLVAPGRVLTAAHVVAGARSIRVVLDAGQDAELEVAVEDWWADPRTDLAVVTIPAEAAAGHGCSPALFGRISGTAAVLPVQASGFPLFKVRATPPGEGEPGVFRDFEQAIGHAPVAANRRQGTLAVYLDAPAPDPHPADGSSPWEGMSGAAVWVAGRIVGVVTEHYPAEGAGRLTARRIDHAYSQLRPTDLRLLADLLGLPGAADGLRDVGYASPSQVVRTAYLAQVRDIAPDELVGRDAELAQWADFCAGPEPYTWWQAGPWAGKSALASWFVTHPPAGVDVVSFFITSRLKGQADSGAFLDAMAEQLSVLGEPGDQVSDPAVRARAGAWLSMLESAAVRSAERGRRLVVVVDGLDEDEAGAAPVQGRVSIASLLPRRPPPGARFILTSRPDPGLPDDVPADHPLHTCQPIALPLSWAAREAESLAKQELRNLLSGDEAEIDTVGYIAGSGGGLTRSDLAKLTGASLVRLDGILRGVFGRSLHARVSPDPRHPQRSDAERVYLFGHETLRVIAEKLLGEDLVRYRQAVHEWMDSCAQAGWPDTTSGYAIRGYPRLLADTDLTRLSALARDHRRHEFLLRATGSDHAALTEITTARQLIAGRDSPDLKAIAELAARWYVLSIRNEYIPGMLPTAWAGLGRFDHAEALTRSMPSYRQSDALAEIACVIAEAGDYDRAEAIASTLPDDYRQPWALADIAVVSAEAGDYDRAEAIANTIRDPGNQDRALVRVAAAIAQAGHRERAAALARTITGPTDKTQSFAELAALAAETGDRDHADQLITEAEPFAYAAMHSNEQARALTTLAAVASGAGDHHRARQLAARAESVVRSITEPHWKAETLAAMASLAAEVGDYQRARQLAFEAESSAGTITDRYSLAESFEHVAIAFTDAGDYDRAEAIGVAFASAGYRGTELTHLARVLAKTGQHDRVETLGRTVADIGHGDQAPLSYVAAVLAEAGNYDGAEAVARTSANPEIQARALASVARELAEAEQYDRAAALACTITVPGAQASAISYVADSIAEAGDCDRAEALVRTITRDTDKLDALVRVSIAIARAGNPDRAGYLLSEAEVAARSLVHPVLHARALRLIAAAIGKTGDRDRAEAIADVIDDPFEQAQALAQAAVMASEAGDHNHARLLASNASSLARESSIPSYSSPEHADLAISIVQLGLHDGAEILARSITNADDQVRALVGIATVIEQNGDRHHARELATEAEAVARTITYPLRNVEALSSIALITAQVGNRNRARELAAEVEAIARTITDPHQHQSEALRHVAVAIAQVGEHEQAEDVARSITVPYYRAEALIDIAKIGEHVRSLALAAEAEAVARTLENPFERVRVLSDAAAVTAWSGNHHHARELAAEAGESAAGIDKLRSEDLADLAVTIAQAGEGLHATRLLARALTVDVDRLWWLAPVVRSFPGDIGDALEVLADAYEL